MESGIFSFIFRYSKRQQVILLIVTAISFPFLYMSFDLPKIIINDAIDGTNFPRVILGFELDQVPYLMVLCVVFLSLVLINGAFKLWINIYRGSMGERMLRRIRYQLIERVMRFPIPHFRNVSQGEVVSIVTTETEPLGGFIGEALSMPAFQGGTLLTILAFMFVQDWALGLAAIALYPAQMYLIPKLQMKLNLLAKKRVATVRKLSERVGELVSGVHEIHANDTSQYELADFSSRLGKIYGIRLDIYRKKFFIKFLNNFIAQITPFFFFSIGGYLVIQGDLSFGALVATLGAYKDLAGPWKELLAYYQKLEDSRIKYQQLVERFRPAGMLEPEMLAPTESVDVQLDGQLVASNLTLEEDEGTKVVAGASFALDINRHTAIVGASGSGKNEVAKLISRQVSPTGGSVSVGGVNLTGVPEAVIGRQVSYIDPEVYINSGTIKDNLFYSLKNFPRSPGGEETEAEHKSKIEESELSGNSTLDVNADWIDYTAIGVDGPEALTERAVEALRTVGLENDIFEFGLRKIIVPLDYPELTEGILKARKDIHEHLNDPKVADLVQVFDKATYNVNASVAENILFGTPVGDSFKVETLGENSYVLEVLAKTGLTKTFLEMGLNIATLMVDLFKDLPPGHEFFERFSFIEEEALTDFQRIINIAGTKGSDNLNEEDSKQLTDLPFKLIVARHRLDLIDDQIQEKLIEARHAFASGLPEDHQGAIEFFDVANYNAAASILDNALFGKIASDKADSRERVVEFVTKTIDDLGLRTAVLEAGLEYDVGIGGKRLTQAQRQRLGLARGLIKNPKLLIVNDATATLAKPDQEQVLAAVREAMKDAGLVWITDDPDSVSSFEVVLAAESGRVKEAKGAAPTQVAEQPATEGEEAASGLGQDVALLASIPFFAGLDRSKLKLLAFASERQKLDPGEILFNQGDTGDMACVIVDGEFDILVATASGPVKVANAATGDVIGELALLCDAPRTATVQAVGDVTILRISKDVFLQLVHDNAEIGANLTRIVAGRLEKMMRGFTGGDQGLYDKVTGLPGHSLFVDRMENAVSMDVREGNVTNLVLLDFNKVLEDVLKGDQPAQTEVLKEIANRLQDNQRKSDTLAKLAGASFGIIAKTKADGEGLDILTGRIRDVLKDPVAVDDAEIDIATNVELEIFTLTEDSAESTTEKIRQRLQM